MRNFLSFKLLEKHITRRNRIQKFRQAKKLKINFFYTTIFLLNSKQTQKNFQVRAFSQQETIMSKQKKLEELHKR